MRDVVSSISGKDTVVLLDDVDAFVDAFENNAGGTYVFDQEHIDVLLMEQKNDFGMQLVDVMLWTGDISLAMALPLSDIWVKDVEGRYLNLALTSRIAYREGALDVYIDEISIPDKEFPENMLSQLALLQNTNIWPELYNSPEFVRFIQRFEYMYVDWGKLYMQLREQK